MASSAAVTGRTDAGPGCGGGGGDGAAAAVDAGAEVADVGSECSGAGRWAGAHCTSATVRAVSAASLVAVIGKSPGTTVPKPALRLVILITSVS